MNTVVKWSNISRRSVLIAVMLFIILFLFWWSILPVPLFQDPYATVLFDREGQVMGMKVADDGQMRFEEVQDLPPRYVISVLVFEDRYFLAHQGELVGFVPGISAEYTGRACGQWGKYAFDAGGAFGFGKSAPYRS